MNNNFKSILKDLNFFESYDKLNEKEKIELDKWINVIEGNLNLLKGINNNNKKVE